jgi:hypothetical protein
MTTHINDIGTYCAQNTVQCLFAEDNNFNMAFTTFEDMLENAIARHENLGEHYKFRFVPVYWALINNNAVNVVGMLRINGKTIEFTHLEEGRREFKNYKACEEEALLYKAPKPKHEVKVLFSIGKFNQDIKENPSVVYGWGYNLTTVPFDESPTSSQALSLLTSAVVHTNERKCKKTA